MKEINYFLICFQFFIFTFLINSILIRICLAVEEEKPLIIVPLTNQFIALLDDESRYNKYATPTQDKGTATNVSMSMFIEGISSFSAQTMDYQMDMYFYQEWKDERLKHNGSGPLLIRDKAIFNKLWHPDIYFANARQASFQEITEDNFMVWIYPNGRVWYDCRISLVAICMMDLWKYPLDSQICELRILSYAYPESHLRLRWSKRILPPIDRNPDIKMPDMRLVDINTGECNGTYATGVWSCMTAVFYVEREMLHHVIQTYIPTALIVVISWFNFWLDIDAAPARVTLSITTLLTIATQANAVKLALPEVSYMKAIDSWMGMCMAFVFSVMVEYTIAHFAKNQEIFPTVQPPLVVDSETLNSIFNAAAHNNNNNRTESDMASHNQPELQGFITSEQLHRHWRKKVCGVLSNGQLSSMSSMKKEKSGGLHGTGSTRSVRSANNPRMVDLEGARDTGDNDSDMSSSTGGGGDERQKMSSKNHLTAEMFSSMEDPRIKRLSRSLPENFNIVPEHIEQVQRKNSFRESARVIRNQIKKLLKLNERAQFIKRTLGQLRGREMANKIDQKSRILFPSAFILMNVCYWSYYLILN